MTATASVAKTHVVATPDLGSYLVTLDPRRKATADIVDRYSLAEAERQAEAQALEDGALWVAMPVEEFLAQHKATWGTDAS